MTYKAAMEQDSGWWIGWIEEIPGVNCQERARDQLLVSLREALREALELNRYDAQHYQIQAVAKAFSEVKP